MALRIEKTFQVNEPIEKVWSFLSDPAKVASCVPGAQITEKIDDKTYKGSISVKVGPSVTDYKGEVQIVRLDPQNHEIEILGKGQDVRGRGSASMTMTGKLATLDGGATQVTSISEVNVVGILAQMGSRVITEVSNIMFEKFSKNFQALLQQPAGQPAVARAEAKPEPIQPWVDGLAGGQADVCRLLLQALRDCFQAEVWLTWQPPHSFPPGKQIIDVDALVLGFERLGYVTDRGSRYSHLPDHAIAQAASDRRPCRPGQDGSCQGARIFAGYASHPIAML